MGIYNSNIDFNKYKYFYAVAEQKSFSKASLVLCVSQPAISRSIKELEEQLGTKLFIRDSKNVKLTENGEILLSYVTRAFNNIITGENLLNEEKQELTGNIKIGIYSHISLFMLPDLIKKFNEKYPYASFEIYASTTLELRDKLLNKQIDFAILQYPLFKKKTNYKEEIICMLDNCFFSGKKYYDMYINKSKKIEEFPIMLPKRGYEDIDSLERIFRRKDIIIKNNFMVYTTELSKKLAMEDIGIGWGLKKCVEKEIKEKNLYEIPTDFDLPKTTFSISYDEDSLNKTSSEFLKFLKKYFKEEFK